MQVSKIKDGTEAMIGVENYQWQLFENYQWVDISGKTLSSFTITEQYLGQRLRVEITYINILNITCIVNTHTVFVAGEDLRKSYRLYQPDYYQSTSLTQQNDHNNYYVTTQNMTLLNSGYHHQYIDINRAIDINSDIDDRVILSGPSCYSFLTFQYQDQSRIEYFETGNISENTNNTTIVYDSSFNNTYYQPVIQFNNTQAYLELFSDSQELFVHPFCVEAWSTNGLRCSDNNNFFDISHNNTGVWTHFVIQSLENHQNLVETWINGQKQTTPRDWNLVSSNNLRIQTINGGGGGRMNQIRYYHILKYSQDFLPGLQNYYFNRQLVERNQIVWSLGEDLAGDLLSTNIYRDRQILSHYPFQDLSGDYISLNSQITGITPDRIVNLDQGNLPINNNRVLAKRLKALDLSGEVVINNLQLDRNIGWSVLCWIYIDPEITDGTYSLLRIRDTTNNNYNLYQINTITNQLTGQKTSGIWSVNNISINRWYKLLLTVKTGDIRLFINDQAITTSIDEISNINNNDTIVIGQNGLHGCMHDLMFFEGLSITDKYSGLDYQPPYVSSEIKIMDDKTVALGQTANQYLILPDQMDNNTFQAWIKPRHTPYYPFHTDFSGSGVSDIITSRHTITHHMPVVKEAEKEDVVLCQTIHQAYKTDNFRYPITFQCLIWFNENTPKNNPEVLCKYQTVNNTTTQTIIFPDSSDGLKDGADNLYLIKYQNDFYIQFRDATIWKSEVSQVSEVLSTQQWNQFIIIDHNYKQKLYINSTEINLIASTLDSDTITNWQSTETKFAFTKVSNFCLSNYQRQWLDTTEKTYLSGASSGSIITRLDDLVWGSRVELKNLNENGDRQNFNYAGIDIWNAQGQNMITDLINQQIDSTKTTNRAVFDFSDNYISEIILYGLDQDDTIQCIIYLDDNIVSTIFVRDLKLNLNNTNTPYTNINTLSTATTKTRYHWFPKKRITLVTNLI